MAIRSIMISSEAKAKEIVERAESPLYILPVSI